MSSILYEKQFAKLESFIHESTYELLMHISLLDMRIDKAMRELEIRNRAMVKARGKMHEAHVRHVDPVGEGPRSKGDNLAYTKCDHGDDVLQPIIRTIRRLQALKVPQCISTLAIAALIVPAAAMDSQLMFPNAVGSYSIPTVAMGSCTGMLFLFGGYLMGAAKSLVGPLMGITSVLYFIMRNDAAVQPRLAWA
ncbi:hypothetical protein BU23DRAFT_573244 [Bimuria novae-zelandiae CBS 107.79]|uniref:Uncharacterized protein n=1 Tax=Bimuria novae-zelandiae CBS 107.79 TaxID=1447943 RepID=A0A6A5UQ87_9PLEO|nr:hypothetical protein BU23DRAFT_573244 [Bimuria novae-zelandiae CBS 107.79]